MIHRRAALVCVAFFPVAGCAAELPPNELVGARAAYTRAESGPASRLTPAELRDAKVALESAEQAFADDGISIRTRDLSYVAERKAELATAMARTTAALSSRESAKRNLQARQVATLSQAQQALASTGQELTAERRARQDAERRARDAIDRLAVAAALAVKEEPRGTVITLPGGVFFESNKATLLPSAQEKLNAIGEALKNQDDRKILVEGHTDSQGTEASNLELSQRRAAAVREYLVSRGVGADKVTAMGLGQGRPVADNKNPEGRANNRRVEIIVQPIEKR